MFFNRVPSHPDSSQYGDPSTPALTWERTLWGFLEPLSGAAYGHGGGAGRHPPPPTPPGPWPQHGRPGRRPTLSVKVWEAPGVWEHPAPQTGRLDRQTAPRESWTLGPLAGRRVGGADSRAVPGLTSAERDRPAAQRGGSLGNRWGGRLAGAELSLGSRAASPEAAGGTAQAPGASGKSGRLSARSCPRVPAPANRRDSPAAVPSPPPAAA